MRSAKRRITFSIIDDYNRVWTKSSPTKSQNISRDRRSKKKNRQWKHLIDLIELMVYRLAINVKIDKLVAIVIVSVIKRLESVLKK